MDAALFVEHRGADGKTRVRRVGAGAHSAGRGDQRLTVMLHVACHALPPVEPSATVRPKEPQAGPAEPRLYGGTIAQQALARLVRRSP